MSDVKPEVIESFKAMWNLYPEPVMLVHKSRDIVARNKMAEEMGIPAGVKCHSLAGRDKICSGCKGNAALKKKEGLRKVSFNDLSDKCLDGYWVPVDGEEDLMVHFGNDISQWVRPEFMKQS